MAGIPPNDTIIVDLLPAQAPAAAWNPQPGPETLALTLPAEGRATIIDEARRVLLRCVPPTVPADTQTGLVVGYVQSGKTMSFTTLAALARDNGYRMVIVIAGTKTPLFNQSKQRLIRDLRLEERPGFNPWRHISQPKVADQSHIAIQNTLSEWNDPTVPPNEMRTIIITVSKNHGRLQHLIDVLQRVDLTGTPTIIIDDEGDQAGLNTQVSQGRTSTTYARILALKANIPQHSYLQYTATPQAPLLINIVDVLSPSFAEVLTPGNGYVGGADFFQLQPNLVRQIPVNQVPPQNMPLNAPPPVTLLEAMRLFFVGVAVGQIVDQSAGRRSMMVHPSQRTDPHRRFYHWVSAARDEWLRILELPDGDADKNDLLTMFRQAYDDIAATAHVPSWDTIVPRLLHAVRRTFVREVNATGGTTTQINWPETYAWILVGGQAMDRGFTVEGLTVTYMPRGLGVGNADTVQQRTRFFGYKRAYLGLCRVFLGPQAQQAFHSYVEHEEDIRRKLFDFRETGRPLAEWRRQFFLDTVLRPTRDNVIDIAYRRYQLGNDWVYPDAPHQLADAVAENRTFFEQFRANHPFVAHTGLDLRQNSPRNQIAANLLLRDVQAELLTRCYRVSRFEDSQYFASMLRLIQLHLMHDPDDRCAVYLMAGGQPRRRAFDNERINQLFQGVQYATQNGQRVTTYPGDRQIKEPQGVSIQMSYLNLGPATGNLIAANVPHLAVWVPPELGRDTVEQPQGGGNAQQAP